MIPRHIRNLYVATLKYEFKLARMYEPGSRIKINAYDSMSLASFDTILHEDPNYYSEWGPYYHETNMAFNNAETQRAIFGWWYRGNGRWEQQTWGDEDE